MTTRITAALGLATDVAIATTMFVFSVTNTSPGALAFTAALAQFVANIIVAVIYAAISATVIGAVIIGIITLIDAVMVAICRWNGQQESDAVKVWVCGGFTGAFTAAINYVIYDQHLLVDMDKDDRLDIQLTTPKLEIKTDTDGYVQGNGLGINAIVTTTLTLDKPKPGGVIDNSYSTNQLKRLMRRSTFAYALQDSDTNIHSDLKRDEVDWGSDNTASFTPSANFPLAEAAINYELPFYLSEGYKLNAIDCWGLVGANEDWTCREKSIDASNHIYMGNSFAFDVLPATFSGLVDLATTGNQSYRLAWDEQFPTLIDADGDGLRSKESGGPDPDDSTWDFDGDGLSDFWELDNGFDPQAADGDNDNIGDYWEAFYGTNPRLADSDGDGWLMATSFTTAKASTPISPIARAGVAAGTSATPPAMVKANKPAFLPIPCFTTPTSTPFPTSWSRSTATIPICPRC
jgi:hypothetical protein